MFGRYNVGLGLDAAINFQHDLILTASTIVYVGIIVT